MLPRTGDAGLLKFFSFLEISPPFPFFRGKTWFTPFYTRLLDGQVVQRGSVKKLSVWGRMLVCAGQSLSATCLLSGDCLGEVAFQQPTPGISAQR